MPSIFSIFYGGGQVSNPANVLKTTGAPSSKLTPDRLGTLAVDNATGTIYGLASKSGGVDTWAILGGGTGAVATLTGDSGTATPAAGNIKIAGTANQIATIGASATVTLSLPAAITAPGSILATTTVASTTTMTAGTGLTATTGDIAATTGNVTAGAAMSATTTITAGTGITATTGDITATTGNFVVTGLTKGVVFPTNATAGANTATLNARAGQVTITTPTIAAGGTTVMTIANSAITGSATQVLYSLVGGTTGAALTIQSYANTADQSVVTIQNGTGATTNTASLILNFIVLN